jgi:hypothetical protein
LATMKELVETIEKVELRLVAGCAMQQVDTA